MSHSRLMKKCDRGDSSQPCNPRANSASLHYLHPVPSASTGSCTTSVKATCPPRPGSNITQALKGMDIRAPRYTSYPTADRFIEGFGPKDYATHLGMRKLHHGVPLSLYVHIPFCEQLCYYCACNKTISRQYTKAIDYVDCLIEELELVDLQLTEDRRLIQMHWGGGTPTYLKAPEIIRLMTALQKTFNFESNGEYSIEIDPRTVDFETLEMLRKQGFNRISLGVQDFNESVQRAINRVQPREMVAKVLEDSRKLGFKSTNFDLIYGLPKQTVISYQDTVRSVIAMRPERIALYNYAHLPTRFKAQRLISDNDMPSEDEKLAIFDMANEQLDAAGYEYIGMDHFALPDDELSVADVLRRSVISAIMCQGEVDKESIEIGHLINFDSYFSGGLTALEPMMKLGYIRLGERLLSVTPAGRRKALRLLAGVFDRYLKEHDARSRFSRVL